MLRAQWSSHSAAEIARAIGMSRSAVLSKAYRIDLPRKRTQGWLRTTLTQTSRKIVAKSADQAVLFFSSRAGQCRWIVTPTGTPIHDVMFCGRPTVHDTSFCATHYKRSHQSRG